MTPAPRQCCRSACTADAVATLTYVYADQTAVVGPLSVHAEPHSYDLCTEHAKKLTVPRGWDVVHIAGEYTPRPDASSDVGALADAVNELTPRHTAGGVGAPVLAGPGERVARRAPGLRVVPGTSE